MHTSARFARQSPRHLAFIAALLAATPSRSRQGRSGGRARTPRYAAWSARWLASQCLCIHTHSMLLYMLANGCVYASVCAHSFVVHKNTEVNRQDNCGMCSHTRTPKEWFETDSDSDIATTPALAMCSNIASMQVSSRPREEYMRTCRHVCTHMNTYLCVRMYS